MQDRRRTIRQRSFLGGKIVFNSRFSIVDCLVRNMSDVGAKLECPSSVPIAQDVDFLVECKGFEARARVVWRSPTEIGLSFANAPSRSRGNVVSIGTARLIQELQTANTDLKRRVSQLSEPA